jgi:hypothetical protein
MPSEFSVKQDDITKVGSDLLLLKYAKSFHGADLAVANLLFSAGICAERDIRPRPDEFVIVETKKVIAPSRVMFLGTPGLGDFNYGRMRRFASRAIEVLATEELPVRTLTTTVHGVNYGLDASESLQNLVRGFQDGLARFPNCLVEKIAFVERRERTARILTSALESLYPGRAEPRERASEAVVARGNDRPSTVTVRPAAPEIEPPKKHVFVAMPFAEEFQDTYEFGIYGPIRRCGFICEKVDEALFTGDILQRILQRISTAEFIVAELSGARANVYLEMGYAWGKNIPVIAIAREGEKLHFDVSRHRCIFYRTIGQLSRELEKLIRGVYNCRDG